MKQEETMEEIKIDIPKGYEFAGIDDNRQQVVFTKMQPEYPKTYEECCRIVNASPYVALVYDKFGGETYSYDIDNLQFYENIRELKICRDAYWKIAGEQMELGKPWKPDWVQATYTCTIICRSNNIVKDDGFDAENKILAFPTEEMRDVFYDNFKELIEQCKELL